MKKTEDILERLKGQMPQVPDGDMLTENIMQAIENGKRGRIIPLWLNVLRVVSSAAAVLLIVMFIGLNGRNEQPAAQSIALSSEIAKGTDLNDIDTALQIKKDKAERRKARQIRETQIQKLYAKF